MSCLPGFDFCAHFFPEQVKPYLFPLAVVAGRLFIFYSLIKKRHQPHIPMTPKFQDNNWILSFREGKGAAFEQVFKEYNRSLCYLAEKYGLDKEEAEDVVADTFTKLWNGRAQFKDEGHIKGFLLTTIRNACLNLVKQKQRRSLSNNELSYLLADNEEDFFRKMVETELLKKLYPYIEQLPEKCRAVFEQVYFEGASTEEAAEKLGISTRNVLNQKARAIQLLRGKILLIAFIYCFVHIYNNNNIHSSALSSSQMKTENKKNNKIFLSKGQYSLFI